MTTLLFTLCGPHTSALRDDRAALRHTTRADKSRAYAVARAEANTPC